MVTRSAVYGVIGSWHLPDEHLMMVGAPGLSVPFAPIAAPWIRTPDVAVRPGAVRCRTRTDLVRLATVSVTLARKYVMFSMRYLRPPPAAGLRANAVTSSFLGWVLRVTGSSFPLPSR